MMLQYFNCLDFTNCDNLDRQVLITIMTTIYSGSQLCEPTALWWFEWYFLDALARSDYKNMSFTDHFEHFLNPEWTQENSFCMDGEPPIGSTEVYAGYHGLGFILNSKEKIHSER